MKELPDDKTLLELLDLAKSAEGKAKSLLDLATEVDEKWRIRLDKRRQAVIEEFIDLKK